MGLNDPNLNLRAGRSAHNEPGAVDCNGGSERIVGGDRHGARLASWSRCVNGNLVGLRAVEL
jgi:hypothetical protein